MYFQIILFLRAIAITLALFQREKKIANSSNINKYHTDTEIKAYSLVEATFADITLSGSESFINCSTKLPLQV